MSVPETRPESPEEFLPHPLLDYWRKLREKAVDTAGFNPNIENFVSLPWVNSFKKDEFGNPLRDKVLQDHAAQIIHHVFESTHPTHILGIERSGIPLAEAVFHYFPQTEFRKATKKQKNQTHPANKITAYSFSLEKNVPFWVPIFDSGSRVLVIDDVCARGSIGKAVISCLQEQKSGEVVGLGVYFDKKFQGGLEEVARELDVPCFSIIKIAGLTEDGIQLVDEREAVKLIT